jgi:hypothetical protein
MTHPSCSSNCFGLMNYSNSLHASSPEVTPHPEIMQSPERPEVPERPEAPERPETTGISGVSGISGGPETSETRDLSESPPCRRLDGPVEARGCSCPDCEIYFNVRTRRPIISVSPEDYHRAIKRFYDPDVIQRRSRYRPCQRHHYVEAIFPPEALTDLPQPPGPIVCSVEYIMWAGLGEVECRCIQVCYRYPKCQVKCEFTLKPNDEVKFYAWGHCLAQ